MIDTEVQPGPEMDTGNDDVHADVRAAFAQHQAEDTTADTGDGNDAPPDRARNERGQFAPKQDGADTGDTNQPLSDADKPSEQHDTPSTAVEPPTSWSAEAKTEWSKLSPALQQAVLKRENEINEGGRRWSEERRAYDEMLSPVREAAQRAGVDEREGIKRLLAADDYLNRDPENAVRWLAQVYGVDLSKPPSQSPQQRPDPVVNQLRQELAEIKGNLTAREQAELNTEITRFASEPGHEHFETVKAEMGKLLTSGLASNMQDAYDKAVWANPDIRNQLIANQTAPAADRQKAQEAVNRAKRGAISATGSPAGQPAPAKIDYDSTEDAARAAARAHGWAV